MILKGKFVRITATLVLLLSAVTVDLIAQSSSENFKIATDGFVLGGGQGTSSDFKVSDSIGQSSPIGVSTGSTFKISAGFNSTSTELLLDIDLTTVTPEPANIANDGISTATITVIPKNSLSINIGSGQIVALTTSLGTLLDQVVDDGDGTYNQKLQSSTNEGTATITAVVNGEPITQAAQVIFTSALCLNDGDVNESIDITPEDARLAFTIFLQEIETIGCQARSADRNCSGTVTPKDASDIFKEYLGEPIPSCNVSSKTTKSAGIFKNSKQPTLASEPALIEIRDVNALLGEEISIPVLITNSSPIISFGFDLIYPSELLTFSSVSKSDLTKDFIFVEGKIINDGLLRVGGFGVEPALSPSTGILVYIDFSVKEDAQGYGEFGFSNLVDDLAEANASGGTITVNAGENSQAIGDINGDGIIDISDLIRAINIVLQVAPSPTEAERTASDCDRNGVLDVYDLVCLINLILGMGGR